jgi:hypothetical protein
MLFPIDIGMPQGVPKWTLIVLASVVIEPHYTQALDAQNDKNHEVIRRFKKDPGV